ncbi:MULTISPECIES: SDR family NAD(P)-dependent oxidoreductase [unclassified Pseudomonas]|uniref:SDR family NAD(P)-dependent oxidoreductase n=1 Tax=unclassified Pseudomonas TaxID=196821 RepID=UPI00244A2B01|nr:MULTISPECIES: SDR family NAD(P)-dependent oxidoreductase [unclassified Pseudomonas]MDH0301956.1 SDR family oxidoreductase [Pseudomonas sp. GD04091]MDH1985707.1 SDR family oxidoreductase [Pseudomonas sp. GD03689]
MTRCVLVTGAGSGIGEACALRLASQGWQVALVGRRAEALERVAQICGGLVLAGDAAHSSTWDSFIARLRERFGGLDAVIACAGGHGLGRADQTSDDAWREALRVNLDSAFHTARACLPLLRERRGSLVLLGSIASLAAGPEVCGYTTAKHALVGLTRSLARDYGPFGVRVNCVCPGWVRTPMADQEMQPLMDHFQEDLDAAYRRVTADVPLRRPASSVEIAAVCQFLVSAEASIVTGAVITADGGSTVVDVPTLAYARLEQPA